MQLTRLSTLLLLAGLTFNSAAQEKGNEVKQDGPVKKTDPKTGKVLYEGTFKAGKPVGTFRYYYPTDSVRAIVKFQPKGSGSYAKLFHPGGKLMAQGKYSAPEVKDSIWTYYDEAGKLLSRETYAGGKKNGASIVYLPDGAIAEEYNYKSDQKHGPFKTYFDGTKVKSKGTYRNDKLEGRVNHMYPNGVEAAAGFYRNGEKTGPWVYKSMDGKITEKELYQNGKLASPRETEQYFLKNPIGPSTPAKEQAKGPATKEN